VLIELNGGKSAQLIWSINLVNGVRNQVNLNFQGRNMSPANLSMSLEDIIRLGIENKATDIHLEARAPVTFRVGGGLKRVQGSVEASALRGFASRLLTEEQMQTFRARGSVDLCRTVSGIQCRINVMRSDHGTGFAIRLLSSTVSSIETCNLHPCLGEIINRDAGLIILTGPTGSGKTTTLAALIDTINERESRHIITLESPIEYRHQSKKSLIRQREIGVHTPSYEQGLMDALREDPDVLVVGEMRDPEAMRLTLNAAETGHLVMATMHSTSAVDAVYRMMMSFPSERQSTILAQIADTLVAVISQKLTFRMEERIMVPCCEILMGTYPARNMIRKGDVSKLLSVLQTGGPEGMFTFDRYQSWLDAKTEWREPPLPKPGDSLSTEPSEPSEDLPSFASAAGSKAEEMKYRRLLVESVAPKSEPWDDDGGLSSAGGEVQTAGKGRASATGKAQVSMRIHKDGRIEIPELDLDLDEIVKEFKNRSE
jgi:twitching motility protein PilT